ncbi:ImmA/IrrE family metallo-endopeptidase [Laribacter hongkongensis]|uniref:ImmA/IrrE family metallo-endopeptidase n=1 Tax=Laribacter hongkongensis TaxID=168471 RepID=UPI001EFD320F|nr:ImmA/IrrE family metallo-endopeptidase [Laribacter hongkongensis]MCG9095324.1 ImmA/IrrE family metallo-endopeptidase [Laribacter hongkongensis]
MVVTNNRSQTRKPCGYRVATRTRLQLRTIAQGILPILHAEGCFKRNAHFLDASHLLENVLHRANYAFHVDESLTETAAFTIPERRLIVLKGDVYDALEREDPFSRFTIVHEFSHIVLDHAVTLHRNAVLGEHKWIEDSEWQANNLSAEIMMPVRTVQQLGGNASLIAATCGTSLEAATYRVENLIKEEII